MSMLEYARMLGLKMGGKFHGVHIGWTTDEEKANAMRQVGARTVFYEGSRKFNDPVNGWEISFPEDAQCQ